MNPSYECCVTGCTRINGDRVGLIRSITLPFPPYEGLRIGLHRSSDFMSEESVVSTVMWLVYQNVFLVDLEEGPKNDASDEWLLELCKHGWSVDMIYRECFDTEEDAAAWAIKETHCRPTDERNPVMMDGKFYLMTDAELVFHEIHSRYVIQQAAAKGTTAQ